MEQLDKTTYGFRMPSGDMVEVGNRQSLEFKPHLKLNRWDGECSIKVGLPITEKSLPIIKGDKITWEGWGRHISMYPVTPEQSELGAYEYEVVLDKKPKPNKIALNIQSQGLKFFYQAPLTQQEMEWGCERPDNIVGSYAVYHATKGRLVDSSGKDYKTGKAFHIYRPKATDAKGNWVWLDQNIAGDTYIITMPQDFLNEATYPIVIDPNFGFETDGGSYVLIGDGNIHACGDTYSPAGDGTGDSMTAYVSDSSDAFRLGVYDGTDFIDNGGTDEATAGADAARVAANFTSAPSLLSATAYTLAIFANATLKIYFDAVATNIRNYVTGETYPTWPDPISWTTGPQKYEYSIFCTYSAAAAGLSIPIAMHHYKMMAGD